VVQADTRSPCSPGEHGELCLKGTASRMKEYLARPKESAEFYEEGWGCTGDLVYYTQDGDICYVDRLKELIK